MKDFIEVDSESITDGAITLEEIVAEVSAVEEEVSEVSDREQIEKEAEELVITREEARTNFNLARRFVEKNCADPAILSYSDKLNEFFYQEQKKDEKQANSPNSFPMFDLKFLPCTLLL